MVADQEWFIKVVNASTANMKPDTLVSREQPVSVEFLLKESDGIISKTVREATLNDRIAVVDTCAWQEA